MLLRREHNHRHRRFTYLVSSLVVLAVVGVWLGQMGFLFHTASTEEFQANFLKLQNDINAGMEYGNAQIGSQYPEMKKSAQEMVNDLGSATAAKLNTQEILNAAAAKVAERLNANVSAQEEASADAPTAPSGSPIPPEADPALPENGGGGDETTQLAPTEPVVQ